MFFVLEWFYIASYVIKKSSYGMLRIIVAKFDILRKKERLYDFSKINYLFIQGMQ